MNIIDFRKICFDKHNRAYFLRVQPDDLKVTLSQIFYVLSDLSWISNFDEDYIRESFQERAKATLADIYAKITTSSTDEVSSDAGEYVVSELAREAIHQKIKFCRFYKFSILFKGPNLLFLPAFYTICREQIVVTSNSNII